MKASGCLEGRHRIEKLRITGDFFVYPESFIDSLEEHLVKSNASIENVTDIMMQFLEGHHEPVEFIGISYDEIISMIVESLKKDIQ